MDAPVEGGASGEVEMLGDEATRLMSGDVWVMQHMANE